MTQTNTETQTNAVSTTWPTYTRVPEDLWKNIQMNAGIVVKGFDPTDGSYDSIIGATDGGVSFNPNPEFYDMGEGIDNLPANTMQLKKIRSYDPTLSGTFKSLTEELLEMLNAAVDTDGTGPIHIVPRMELTEADFEEDVTLIADYSDVNTGANAGWLAVRIFNALNTTGFQWQTQNQDKGQFSFEFHGHYDLTDLDQVPFDIYMKAGTAATGGGGNP